MLIFWILIAAVIFSFCAHLCRAAAEPDPSFRLPSLWYLPHALGLWAGIIGLLLW